MSQPPLFVSLDFLRTMMQQTDGSALQCERMAAYVRELLIVAPIELTEGEWVVLVQPAMNATIRVPDQDPTHTRWIVAEPLKFVGFGD